jgi:hypothetical protein
MISKSALKTLLDLYLGDTVILYLKNINVVIPNEDGEHMDVSAMLTGMVMDIDENFIHLGDGDMIKKSVYHENIALIESMIVDNNLISDDLPENDLEIN